VGKKENEREGEGFWGNWGEKGGGGWANGPKGARGGGGWAGQGRLGRAGAAHGAGERKREEREKEKEKERKGFFSPFRNPIFLDECTYISKQSKNAQLGMVHQTT
jgi:hypothetical protein